MGHKIKPKHKFVNQTCIRPSVEADKKEEEYYNIEGIIFWGRIYSSTNQIQTFCKREFGWEK